MEREAARASSITTVVSAGGLDGSRVSVSGVSTGIWSDSAGAAIRSVMDSTAETAVSPVFSPIRDVHAELFTDIIDSIVVQCMPYGESGQHFPAIKNGDVVFALRMPEHNEPRSAIRHSLIASQKQAGNLLPIATYKDAVTYTQKLNAAVAPGGDPVRFLETWVLVGVVRGISGGVSSPPVITVCVRGQVEVDNVWDTIPLKNSVVGFCDYLGGVPADRESHISAFPTADEVKHLTDNARYIAAGHTGAAQRAAVELYTGPTTIAIPAGTAAHVRDINTFVVLGRVIHVADPLRAVLSDKTKSHGVLTVYVNLAELPY